MLLNKHSLLCCFLIFILIAQPLTLTKTAAAAQQSQKLFWNNDLDSKKNFGPETPITIDIGDIEYIFSCDGETNRVSNFDWIRDWLYLASDIYISKSPTDINPKRGNPVFIEDVNNAINTVVTPPGRGIFEDFTIGSTINIGNGKYDVIYDECQDRRFQLGEDAIFDEAITIDKPVNYTLTQEARQAFISSKLVHAATANTLEEISEYVDKLFLLYKFGKWTHGLRDSPRDTAGEAILDLVVTLVNNISKDLGVFVDSEIPTGLDDITKLVIVTILNKNALKHRQLAADPPNLSYEKNISLENMTLNLKPVIDDKLNNLLYSFIKEVDNERVILQAFLSSLESFQGAQIEGNSIWGIIHVQSLKKYSNLLSGQLSNSNSTISSIINTLEDDYSQLNSDITTLETLRKRVQESGFTLEETKFLKNSNFTDVQINKIREAFLSINFSFTLEQFIDSFKDISKNHNALQRFLNIISNEIDKTVKEIQENPINKFLNPPPVSIIDISNGIIGQSIISMVQNHLVKIVPLNSLNGTLMEMDYLMILVIT